MELGNYKKSIEQFLEAISVSQTIPNGPLGANYLMLGFTYSKTKQYEASAKALEKAMAIGKRDKYLALEVNATITLAGIYRILNEQEKAIATSNYSLSFIDKIEDPFTIAKIYRESGKIAETFLGFEEQALDYYNSAYNTAKNLDAFSRFQITRTLAQYFLKKDQLEKARPILDELIELSQKLERIDFIAKTELTLSKYYEKKGDADLALKHFKTYYKLNDSISNKEILKQTSYYEREFDFKQKEVDILQLNEANRQQKAATLMAEDKQRRYLYGVLFLGSLFLLGAFGTYQLNKQKRSLELAHNRLTELNGIKDRLFSIIAHDVRGMIMPFQRAGKILGYHIDKGDHDRAKYLSEELGNNADRLSNMLDNLLKWSLDQLGEYEIQVEEISIKKELESIVSGYNEIAGYKHNDLQLVGQTDGLVTFDKNAFHVILRNLIGNALKYTEYGFIKIDWRKTNSKLEIEVKDSGIGIDKTKMTQLFELGNKELKPGTKGEKGTGLGLHLVNQFVKKLNGQITVESELNKGTVFLLRFPIQAS